MYTLDRLFILIYRTTFFASFIVVSCFVIHFITSLVTRGILSLLIAGMLFLCPSNEPHWIGKAQVVVEEMQKFKLHSFDGTLGNVLLDKFDKRLFLRVTVPAAAFTLEAAAGGGI